MEKQSVIQIEHLIKRYRLYNKPSDRIKESFSLSKKNYSTEYNAINNISIDIKKGEIVGIIGKNGSGKSTLLKMITGVVTPTAGIIKTQGKIAALLELGTGFNPEYTGIENIYLHGTMMGYSKEETEGRINDIIDFADIGEFINQPVKTYSSGMFARLAFAVAIHVDPDILIADEILSVGDVNFQNKCINTMKEMVKKGTTILFVSHDLHAIKYFCDRVIWLHQGEIVDDSINVVNVIDNFERNIGVSNQGYEICSSATSDIKITSTYLKDNNGNQKRSFKVNEQIRVIIEYEVYREIRGEVFIGVGLRNSRNVYVNGLNTKLDGIKVDTSIGRHKIELVYTGLHLYKDIYTMWSVCYNWTGTVVMSDYIMKDYLEIYNLEEIGEGVTYIPHEWRQYE